MKKIVKKIQKLQDCKIVITPSESPDRYMWYKKNETEQEREKRRSKFYDEWVKDFKEFLRDHRSQDVQDIYVDKIYIDVCSNCGNEWDEGYDEDIKEYYCGNCGHPTETNDEIKETVTNVLSTVKTITDDFKRGAK